MIPTHVSYTKPNVFIGSSLEGLDVAYTIQQNLENESDITVWSQGVFNPSQFTIDDLVKQLEISDFGIFVFTPDDIVTIREEKQRKVRDNVIFELGLFIGRISRNRSFIITPKDIDNMHLPSDLFGLNLLKYVSNRNDNNLAAALGPACNQIRALLKNFSPSSIKKNNNSML